MPVTIQIPTPLRRFTAGQGVVSVHAKSVGDAMKRLVEQNPGLLPHLYGDDGQLRAFVNLFLNEEDVRYLNQENTALSDGDELTIIPSIAGGSSHPGSVVTGRELPALDNEEIRRYSRHLILPEIGSEGQRALKAARVLMVGTGGLGSPIGMYLAAAGVGTLGMVDFDVVDESNLHRQLLFGVSDVGRHKTEAAADRLREVNPKIELIEHETRLDSSNALELAADYDLVVDGTDNFPTRYLVNDVCVLSGKPNVYGSIFRFEGQVSVFWGAEGPCYRCLFPEPPPPGLVPSCAEGGVLGVLPGIIGCLQANEVIKLITGSGEPMIGRLLLFDALAMKFRELKLRKSPDCPICSESPTLTELIDYHQFCGVPAPGEEPEEDPEIDVTTGDLKRWLDGPDRFTLLDVRSSEEREICSIEGSLLIPVGELERRLDELDPQERIVVHCHKGPRSTRAVHLLRGAGFTQSYNLKGGIDAWSVEVDPAVPPLLTRLLKSTTELMMTAKLTFLGHSGFLISDGSHTIAIDPFLTGNPVAVHSPEQIQCGYIALTHGHADHVGDSLAIAKANDANVIAAFEIVNWFGEQGHSNGNPGNPGGKIETEFGWVAFTQAFHSSSYEGAYMGMPCGLMIHIGGATIYHCGDTGLFGDMKLLGELYQPDIALVPIGDRFTMGPGLATRAAELIGAPKAVPIHHGTWPPIEVDAGAFAPEGVEVIHLAAGEDLEV